MRLKDFLSEIGLSVIYAYRSGVKAYMAGALSDENDIQVDVYGNKVPVDGVSLLPQKLISLENLEIETETDVHVKGDEIVLGMSRGLRRKGMHVHIKARFASQGSLEAIELLRDHGNKRLSAKLDELVNEQVAPK